LTTLDEIDSDDLEALEMYRNYPKEIEDLDVYERAKEVQKALKGLVRFGPYFDWKEEDKMNLWLSKVNRKLWPYVYNAYPGGDGIQTVLSKVKLEKVEEVV